MSAEPNFDAIARPYKLLEYLTLGSTLQRCRTHFIPDVLKHRSALILGDGDGRFLAQLLAANQQIRAEAVDTSGTMLRLLRKNCMEASPTAATRLKTQRSTAHAFLESMTTTQSYDLVVTHFFLDCLTQAELDKLVRTLKPHLAPGALWLISDFQIPPKGQLHLVARALVRGLYLAFRILTGLRTTRLPDHETPLAAAGLTRIAHQDSLGGIVTAELWQSSPPSTRPLPRT